MNDTAQAHEGVRQKISSYLELKKLKKEIKMGTSIQNRHKFFREQDEEFVAELKKILNSTEKSDEQRYTELIKELETMWPVTIENLVDDDDRLKKFELGIDYDKFSCVLISSEAQLQKQVLDYFYDMLNIKDILLN